MLRLVHVEAGGAAGQLIIVLHRHRQVVLQETTGSLLHILKHVILVLCLLLNVTTELMMHCLHDQHDIVSALSVHTSTQGHCCDMAGCFALWSSPWSRQRRPAADGCQAAAVVQGHLGKKGSGPSGVTHCNLNITCMEMDQYMPPQLCKYDVAHFWQDNADWHEVGGPTDR